MELPLAALGCKLSGYVPEVPPGQMQRRGAATHGQTCFAPNRWHIFWRPPSVALSLSFGRGVLSSSPNTRNASMTCNLVMKFSLLSQLRKLRVIEGHPPA